MYKIVKAREKLRVPPAFFRREKEEAIKEVVEKEYRQKIDKNYGYVLNVVDAEPIGKGIVAPGDPNVYYETEYTLLTFTVEPNEIVVGIVCDVIEFGAFVNIGPFEALLHISQIGREKFILDKKSKALVNKDRTKALKKGDVILAKVSSVSFKGTVADVKIGLTMRGPGLGKLDWLLGKSEKKAKATKSTAKASSSKGKKGGKRR